MAIVIVKSKSKHGFVVNEVRGTVITKKGFPVDTDSNLYNVIRPYISSGVLVEETEITLKKSTEKVVEKAPVEKAVKNETPEGEAPETKVADVNKDNEDTEDNEDNEDNGDNEGSKDLEDDNDDKDTEDGSKKSKSKSKKKKNKSSNGKAEAAKGEPLSFN